MYTPLKTYAKKRFAISLYSSGSSGTRNGEVSVDVNDSPDSSQEGFCFSSQETILDDIYDSSTSFRALHDFEINSTNEFTNETSFGKSDVFTDIEALPKRGNSKKVHKKRRVDKSAIIEKDHENSELIIQDESHFSALQDDIEYNMQGLEGKAGDNKENTINNKQVLSKKRNIQRASALNLVKLAKSKPLEVGQLLRSTPDLLMRLFKVLNNSLESDQPDDHHFMALCAAAVIFFLFRNSLNSEYVTTDCVELLLKLASFTPPEYNKPKRVGKRQKKAKIIEATNNTIQEMIKKITNLFDQDEEVSVSSVASRALVNVVGFTQENTKLREDLRNLGVLDRVALLITNCQAEIVRKDDQKVVYAKLKELIAFLQLLEDATYNNKTNQSHLLGNSSFMSCLTSHVGFCQAAIAGTSTNRKLLLDSLMATLKVLLNVTNDNDMGCCIVGSGLNQLCTVLCCLELYPDETWHDLQSLLIALLVNLVEKVEENRTAIRSINLDGHRSALDLLVKLYSKNARDLTSNTAQHDIMRNKEIQVSVGYLAILLGILAKDTGNREIIAKSLPSEQSSFQQLAKTIQNFIHMQHQNGILFKEAYNGCCDILKHVSQLCVTE